MASHNNGDPPDGLSPKAQEIKKAIEEGTYKVDLDCLADRLIEDGALDDAPDPRAKTPAAAVGTKPPQSD